MKDIFTLKKKTPNTIILIVACVFSLIGSIDDAHAQSQAILIRVARNASGDIMLCKTLVCWFSIHNNTQQVP
jgi:hypothetical protein